MIDNMTDALDGALERFRAGESLSTILADYPAQAETLSSLLEAAASVATIRPLEMPAPEAFRADRADFLAGVTLLQQQAVSPGPVIRLKERIAHVLPWSLFNQPYSGRRQRRMSSLLIKATLMFGLLFGSAGATAAMASTSLPDSPLYPVKLAMEEARLAMTGDPAEQAKLHLTLAQERTQEMEKLALKGGIPGEATLTQLQKHLNHTLQLAGQLPDEEMNGVLIQARQSTQAMAGQMSQTMAQVGGPAQEPLGQASQFMNQVRQDIEAGLQDPLTFRHRFGHNRPEDEPLQPTREPGFNRDVEPTTEPVPSDEPAPLVDAEPTEESDDCPAGDCEPVGDQNQYGGRDSDVIPGYGEPCENPADCPAGDENKYQSPGPHSDGCDPSAGCEPAGDQDQNGDLDRSQDREGVQIHDRDRDQIQDHNQPQEQHQNQTQDQDQDQSQDNSDSNDSGDGGDTDNDSSSSKDHGSSSGGNSDGGGKK